MADIIVQPLAKDSLASNVLLTSLPKHYYIISIILGILDPPPILSIECKSLRFILLSDKHSSINYLVYSKKLLLIFSNSSLVIV